MDSFNLRVDPSAPQVFNFCTSWGSTRWGRFADAPCFLSSTEEEGILWMDNINSNDCLVVLGCQLICGHLGSALAFHPCGNLVVANYNLYEFVVPTGPLARER